MASTATARGQAPHRAARLLLTHHLELAAGGRQHKDAALRLGGGKRRDQRTCMCNGHAAGHGSSSCSSWPWWAGLVGPPQRLPRMKDSSKRHAACGVLNRSLLLTFVDSGSSGMAKAVPTT